MNATLRKWYERGYINYSLIPFVALGLVIAHQVYLNLPVKDERPTFIIGGESEGRLGGLSLAFSVEDKIGKVGDEFMLELTLTNNGEEDCAWRIGLPLFDIMIHDENGSPIARWSDGRKFPGNLFLIHLTPGEEFSETKVWDLALFNHDTGEMEPLDKGRYWLSGVWLGDPVVETGRIRLTVGRSPSGTAEN